MTIAATISETSRGCYLVDMDATSPGWSQEFLLRSDAHHDNAHTNHRLEAIHLEEALDRLLMSPGNHEGSILKRHETDLTERTAERLRSAGSPVIRGTYSGFVRFSANVDGDRTLSRVMHYHHGHGGGGLMTHGVLNTRRKQSFLPDADIIWNGHTHDSWSVRLSKARLTSRGTVRLDDVHHVSTPGYKDEFSPMDGWHVERGGPPKPIGAAWLRLSIEHLRKPVNHRRLKIEIREAT